MGIFFRHFSIYHAVFRNCGVFRKKIDRMVPLHSLILCFIHAVGGALINSDTHPSCIIYRRTPIWKQNRTFLNKFPRQLSDKRIQKKRKNEPFAREDKFLSYDTFFCHDICFTVSYKISCLNG